MGQSSHTRQCPSCKAVLSYTTVAGLTKALANNKPCRRCVRRQDKPTEVGERILKAYASATLTNREIAATVGCTHRTVAYWLNKKGLKPHLSRGVPPERVDADHSRCRKCNDVQANDQFPFVRGRVDGRRLSICRACRAKDAREALGATPESYFNDRERRMRNGERGSRPNRRHLAFDLPSGYLAALWRWQQGLCFYTGSLMKLGLGVGHDPYGVSIDRVDPEQGYLVGNVVLCCRRVNTIKSNLTLDELAEWITPWYVQIETRLPALLAEVEAPDDNWPRNAAGRRLPSWIVERRERIAALSGAMGLTVLQVADGDF